MQFFDVWKQTEDNLIVPVETDVRAESPEQAVETIAQETGIPASDLRAFEASNPGYREV